MASVVVALPPREELFERESSNLAVDPRTVRTGSRAGQPTANAAPPSSTAMGVHSAQSVVIGEERAKSLSDDTPVLAGPEAIPQFSGGRAFPTGVVVPRHTKLAPHKPGKMTVVLDMDECLLHSKFHGPGAALEVYRQCEERPDTVSELGVDSFWVALEDGDTAQVNKRPGLDQFLEALARDYNTIVFTAAMPDYAGPVLDYIDPNGTLFHQRFYRSSCRQVKQAFLKDLTVLGIESADMSRIVLVDNNPLSFLCQPTNGILVAPFYDDPADTALASVMQLVRHLEKADDVRPILKYMFQLDNLLGEYRDALFDGKGDDQPGVTYIDEGEHSSARAHPDVTYIDEGQHSSARAPPKVTYVDESQHSPARASDVRLFADGMDECPKKAVKIVKDDDQESVETEACSEESIECSIGESLTSREIIYIDEF